MGKIELYNTDNMQLMKQYADKYFDLAIVDPPYGINWYTSGTNKIFWNSKNGKKAKKWDIAPTKEYFDELFRVSKNQIIWGTNHFANNIPSCNSVIVWDKTRRRSVFADCEIAFAYISDFTEINIFKGNAIFEMFYNPAQKNDKIHPTQKPPELYKWLLLNYAKKGDKILDTNLGSGTIALACDELGFDLVGCEIDKEYFEGANKKLNQFRQQLRLPI